MSATRYPITPVAYVRQTRADRWKKRPAVLRYRAYRDEVVARKVAIINPDYVRLIFLMPTSKSWTTARKADMPGRPHMQRPDLDNLVKGLLDAIYRDADDSHIWHVHAEKLWAREGGIVVADSDMDAIREIGR